MLLLKKQWKMILIFSSCVKLNLMKIFQINTEMQSYKAFCQNRNKHGGGVMFYVNENIPCRVLNIDFNFNDLETIFLKFYLRNRKCLCVSSYKRNQNDQYFLDYINKSLTKFSYQFDTTMLLEDFTLTTEN